MIVRMRGQDGLTEREKVERSGGVVLLTVQVTMRMRGQDGLAETEENESLGGSVWLTVSR
jgi:hypothetical protein